MCFAVWRNCFVIKWSKARCLPSGESKYGAGQPANSELPLYSSSLIWSCWALPSKEGIYELHFGPDEDTDTFSGNNRTTISHSSHGDSMEIHLLHKIVYGLLMLLFACLCCFTEKFAFILPKMDSQQAEHCMHTRMALTIDSLQCPPWSSVKRPWEPYIDLKLFTMVVTFGLCYLLFHLAKQSLISGIYLAWWMLYRISIIQSS